MSQSPNVTEMLFITNRADAQQYQDTLVNNYFKRIIADSNFDEEEKKDAERMYLLWQMLGVLG
jgi:hypothetical protein